MADYQSTAPTTKSLTLQEAKRHLNVSSTADDTLITEYIDAATLLLEKRCNRAFVDQTRKCTMQTFADSRYVTDRTIYLPVSPLSSVSSITYVNASGTTTTLPSSDYIVSAYDRPGTISEAYNATWPDTYNVPNDVVVTYVVGHSSVSSGIPKHVKHALRLVIGEWYRNREMTPINWDVVSALLESEQIESYG